MPRGAKLTPYVENLIVEVCIDHPEWLAKPSKIQQEVIRRLPDSLKTWGGSNWPGIDVIKNRLRENIRPKLENIPPESKRLDEPWSLAASVKYGIPPEASKDLFDIWRFSLALDRPISIRQARWIVYIRFLYGEHFPVPVTYSEKVARKLDLIRQGWRYSIAERVAELTRHDFDSASVDMSFLLFSERRAIVGGRIDFRGFPQELLDRLREEGVDMTVPPQSVVSVEQAVWHAIRHPIPPNLQSSEVLSGGFDDVLPDEDMDILAAHWLTVLGKGPSWKELEYLAKKEIRLRLLDWVKQGGRTLDPELLKVVGYNVSTSEGQKREAQNER